MKLNLDKSDVDFYSHLLSLHESKLTPDERHHIKHCIRESTRLLKNATWTLLEKVSKELELTNLDVKRQ